MTRSDSALSTQHPELPRSGGAGENGHDIARPAEFLIDKGGVVRWEKITDDFRVRARPEEMLAAAKRLP